jgi:hypothetical protein
MTDYHDAIYALQCAMSHPHGAPATDADRRYAGEACVNLCGGNQDQARTLWKLIVEDLGYMPYAAARALLRAAHTGNLVPDIEPPDLDGPRGPAADGKVIS